ncbi:MAG: peptidylprolyl isomerase [Proteobacteria bacterium]|nr:peptidylprolyl isomerase [Pseudomonadota bacterium]
MNRLRVTCAAACAVFCLAGPAAAQRISLVDRIVAVVNSEVVTNSELAERLAVAERQMRKQNTPLPEPRVLERQVLERLILEKAQLQMAKETGLRVDEVQLDRTLSRIAENNKMTLAAFRQALERDGVQFDRFRDEIRSEIMLTRLREREVDDKIQISDSEIELYMAENAGPGAPQGDVEYNIAHVLVRLPEQASPESIQAARARAEKVIAEARAGADFAKLAASYSDAPDALAGGLMGWRAHDRLPELFSTALKDLAPGGVSQVLRSPAGFHVLKLIERRGGATLSGAPVRQTHARHILIKTSEVVSENEAKRRLADIRERVMNGADFAELAKVNSADGSASKGGDLDWVYPGDTVPEFERAMDELKPGEISQPVKSPFGYHLIQVLERRVADVSAERRRLQARQALRERRVDEAYQDWLRQLRDRTYVEIRLDDK